MRAPAPNPASWMIARTSFLDFSECINWGFHSPEELCHFRGVDVLMHVFGVVRPEQLGELVTGVFDEIAESPQACQDDQVPGVEPLPSSSAAMTGSTVTFIQAPLC